MSIIRQSWLLMKSQMKSTFNNIILTKNKKNYLLTKYTLTTQKNLSMIFYCSRRKWSSIEVLKSYLEFIHLVENFLKLFKSKVKFLNPNLSMIKLSNFAQYGLKVWEYLVMWPSQRNQSNWSNSNLIWDKIFCKNGFQ